MGIHQLTSLACAVMITAILVLFPLVSGSPFPGQHFTVWNNPSVVAHHRPVVAAHYQPAVVAHHQPAVVGYRQPAVVAHQQPAVVAHHQPVGVRYHEPTFVAHHRPAVISYRQPAVVTHYNTPIVSHFNPAVVRFQTKSLVGCSSGNFVKQTRCQADFLKQTLNELKSDSREGKYITRVIEGSACLNSLDDAINAMEQSTKLVESAEKEILTLTDKARLMQTKTDTVALVKDAADILRLLEDLIPKIAPANPEICGASSEETFDALRDIADMMVDISKDKNIQLTNKTNNDLEKSGRVIIGVTTFVTQLRGSFSQLKQSCSADKNYNIEAIKAIGETMDNLANLFGVLGGFGDAEEIRKQGAFATRVADAVNNLGLNLDSGTLNCETPGSFKVAAQTLDDLADIIADVGIEELQKQIGIKVFEL